MKAEIYPRDTPRTNAHEESCGDYEKPHAYARRTANFARSLERELTALQAKLEAAEKEIRDTRRAWLGRDYGHLSLPDAVGKLRENMEAAAEKDAARYKAVREDAVLSGDYLSMRDFDFMADDLLAQNGKE